MGAILGALGGLFIVGLATRWFRRLVGDTRVIVEAPVKREAVRCGKCQCKFTYTARDVNTVYREARVSCPACRQRLRIFVAAPDEAFGAAVGDDDL